MADGMTVHGSLMPLADKLLGLDKRLTEVMKVAAFKLERIIVLHIQDQDLPWKDIDKKYKARKIREGFSEKILIRTGTALETVRVIKIDENNYFVGWPRGVQHKRGGEIVQIMAVHEYGSNDGTIEARPVVAPSVKELRKWLETELRNEIKVAFA
jgi:hypothetical protein